MKEIYVKTNLIPNPNYIICLGDGTKHIFQNQKAAEAFQNKTNRFLTELLASYNEIFSTLYGHYRFVWIYFYNTKNPSKSNHFDNEQKLKQSFDSVDKTLDLLTTSFSRSDSFYRVYRDFEIISEDLLNACFILRQITTNKSIIAFDQVITNQINHIKENQARLNSYSTLTTDHIITFDRLQHVSRYVYHLQNTG